MLKYHYYGDLYIKQEEDGFGGDQKQVKKLFHFII
jgi:hypothetical protein